VSEKETVLREALTAAQKALRDIYDKLQEGCDPDTILENERFWPLTQIREALK
jgi:hypothetical protein